MLPLRPILQADPGAAASIYASKEPRPKEAPRNLRPCGLAQPQPSLLVSQSRTASPESRQATPAEKMRHRKGATAMPPDVPTVPRESIASRAAAPGSHAPTPNLPRASPQRRRRTPSQSGRAIRNSRPRQHRRTAAAHRASRLRAKAPRTRKMSAGIEGLLLHAERR